MNTITDEEQLCLKRVGLAIKTRRRLKAYKPDVAGNAAGIGETGWRRLEQGHPSMKLAGLLRGMSTLGLNLNTITLLMERALLSDLEPEAIKTAMRNPETVGRPKKGVASEEVRPVRQAVQ